MAKRSYSNLFCSTLETVLMSTELYGGLENPLQKEEVNHIDRSELSKRPTIHQLPLYINNRESSAMAVFTTTDIMNIILNYMIANIMDDMQQPKVCKGWQTVVKPLLLLASICKTFRTKIILCMNICMSRYIYLHMNESVENWLDMLYTWVVKRGIHSSTTFKRDVAQYTAKQPYFVSSIVLVGCLIDFFQCRFINCFDIMSKASDVANVATRSCTCGNYSNFNNGDASSIVSYNGFFNLVCILHDVGFFEQYVMELNASSESIVLATVATNDNIVHYENLKNVAFLNSCMFTILAANQSVHEGIYDVFYVSTADESTTAAAAAAADLDKRHLFAAVRQYLYAVRLALMKNFVWDEEFCDVPIVRIRLAIMMHFMEHMYAICAYRIVADPTEYARNIQTLELLENCFAFGQSRTQLVSSEIPSSWLLYDKHALCNILRATGYMLCTYGYINSDSRIAFQRFVYYVNNKLTTLEGIAHCHKKNVGFSYVTLSMSSATKKRTIDRCSEIVSSEFHIILALLGSEYIRNAYIANSLRGFHPEQQLCYIVRPKNSSKNRNTFGDRLILAIKYYIETFSLKASRTKNLPLAPTASSEHPTIPASTLVRAIYPWSAEQYTEALHHIDELLALLELYVQHGSVCLAHIHSSTKGEYAKKWYHDFVTNPSRLLFRMVVKYAKTPLLIHACIYSIMQQHQLSADPLTAMGCASASAVSDLGADPIRETYYNGYHWIRHQQPIVVEMLHIKNIQLEFLQMETVGSSIYDFKSCTILNSEIHVHVMTHVLQPLSTRSTLGIHASKDKCLCIDCVAGDSSMYSVITNRIVAEVQQTYSDVANNHMLLEWSRLLEITLQFYHMAQYISWITIGTNEMSLRVPSRNNPWLHQCLVILNSVMAEYVDSAVFCYSDFHADERNIYTKLTEVLPLKNIL